MIETIPGGLSRYRPSFRYFLIDEGRYQDSELKPVKNAVAALFRLEKSRSPEAISEVLVSLIEWLKAPEQTPLRRDFTVWFGRVFFPTRAPGHEFREFNSLTEVNAMLSETVIEWTKTWKEEGRQEGRQEGLLEGQKEASLKIARTMLQKGMPIPQILEVTGLTEEDVKSFSD